MSRMVKIEVTAEAYDEVLSQAEPFALVRQKCIEKCGKLNDKIAAALQEFEEAREDFKIVPSILCDGTVRNILGCSALELGSHTVDGPASPMILGELQIKTAAGRLAAAIDSGLVPINLKNGEMMDYIIGRSEQVQKDGYPKRFFKDDGLEG